MGVNFFHRKKTKPGGGSAGGLAKDHTFSGFFFRLPSLIMVEPMQVVVKFVTDATCKYRHRVAEFVTEPSNEIDF